MTTDLLDQKQFLELVLPFLKSNGILYQKSGTVLAREAVEGETVDTVTGDGKETTNTAKAGDFLIQNGTTAKERYFCPGEKFAEKYDFIQPAANGLSLYQAKGKVIAFEVTEAVLRDLGIEGSEFQFNAPWGELMVCKVGDMLVCPPDYSETYRIALKEFNETYGQAF